MTDAGLPPGALLAATAATDLGLAALVGAWASLHWLRRATSPWAGRARVRSSFVLRAASVATLAVDLVRLWLQAADMADVPLADALGLLPSVLWQTSAGRAGAVGLAGLLLAAGVARRAEWRMGAPSPTESPVGAPSPDKSPAGAPSPDKSPAKAPSPDKSPAKAPRRALLAVGVGLFVVGRAAVSHAGGQGLATPWVLAECLHLAAVSLWGGAVGMAAFGVLPLRSHGRGDAADTARWIARLSRAATLALVVLGATGGLAAWRGTGSAAVLVHSAYGGALLVKLGFVGIAVGLGGFNRWRVMPRLLRALDAGPDASTPRSQRRFVHILRAEAVALICAFVAAVFLAATPSPAAM